MIEIEINAREVQARIEQAAAKLENMRPLMQRVAGVLEHETEADFAAQGRPPWAPLSKATIAKRLKRNQGRTVQRILQDRDILASSISTQYGADSAQIGVGGAARDYAAIHQFGGTIQRAAQSRKTRLRTDTKGNVVRQGNEDGAQGRATFAEDRHKRARETWSTVGPTRSRSPPGPSCPSPNQAPMHGFKQRPSARF